jgi:hypothetical protein
VKYGLRGNLTLDVAVNPDFGQAEVDPAVLNLGPFEVFFPGAPPVLPRVEGDLRDPVPAVLLAPRRQQPAVRARRPDDPQGRERQRRDRQLVQLDPLTRIFGAVRLTGRASKSWSVGALTATTGATYGTEQFSDGNTHRVSVDPTSQYSVLRVRKEFDSQTSVGAIATGVVRGGGEPSAFTGGFDYRIRFADRWRHSAQVIGTHDGAAPAWAPASTSAAAARTCRLGWPTSTCSPRTPTSTTSGSCASTTTSTATPRSTCTTPSRSAVAPHQRPGRHARRLELPGRDPAEAAVRRVRADHPQPVELRRQPRRPPAAVRPLRDARRHPLRGPAALVVRARHHLTGQPPGGRRVQRRVRRAERPARPRPRARAAPAPGQPARADAARRLQRDLQPPALDDDQHVRRAGVRPGQGHLVHRACCAGRSASCPT